MSHGHPDHLADLHPLLRARALGDSPSPALPVYTQPGAVDVVLALDGPGMLDDAYQCREFAPGDRFTLGPFSVETWLLPHFQPNAGIRLKAGGKVLAYTGDTGPSRNLVSLAADVDLLVADATFADHVPEAFRPYLSTAREAGKVAALAGVRHLMLSHPRPSGRGPRRLCRRSLTPRPSLHDAPSG